MARPLRIEFEGAWYHVMNRGAARQHVFRTDDQRHYFLELLGDASERFNAEWHAYCLMGNHYHLLIRTPEGNLQRIMRHVNGLYTQYYNRVLKRDGSLFRGRYKAILVDAEAYWLRLSRYIHRNPLEAKLVKRLDQYPWSSYPVYIGIQNKPDWLECDYILKSLAVRKSKERYKSYVEEGPDFELLEFYGRKKLDPVLGGDDYKKLLKLEKEEVDVPELKRVRVRPTIDRIIQAVCDRLEVEPKALSVLKRGRAVDNPARGMAMYLCQREGDMRLGEIASYFGLKNYTSAGSGIRQFQKRLEGSSELQRLVKLIKLDLTP
ncbi:MAG TPA: transposase [Gammaproteobacteria bacterium]